MLMPQWVNPSRSAKTQHYLKPAALNLQTYSCYLQVLSTPECLTGNIVLVGFCDPSTKLHVQSYSEVFLGGRLRRFPILVNF